MKFEFFYCNEDSIKLWNDFGVFFSTNFCQFFSANIKRILTKETGIKPSFKVGLSAFGPDDGIVMYEPGIVSKINSRLSILPMFYDNISFCWKSKTGKIVHTTDEDFDEDDLICWIEGLKPELYWKQIATENKAHPFQVANLPYSLKVYGFSTHLHLNISLHTDECANEIKIKLYELIEAWNAKSEANSRNQGVVHNYSAEIFEGKILLAIDTGSAGVLIVKKILKQLAKFPSVKEVIIDF